MKLGLQSDFGSPGHWRRLVELAKKHDVDRLVFLGDSQTGCFDPYVFPRYPGLLTDEELQRHRVVREYMTEAARLTREAGIEFWYWFNILQIPRNADRWESLEPGMFNSSGEPDMTDPRVYRILEDQIDELMEIAPGMSGIAVWMCEISTVSINSLRSQSIPFNEIAVRIVDTVHAACEKHELKMSLNLHTDGYEWREAMLSAARGYPDVIVADDSTAGDHQLNMPFNPHLWRAAFTNPVQVGFDLNGEYWGRNIYPTCAVGQYREYLQVAHVLGAEWVEGRVNTMHDMWSPYANVLPSRRRFYPTLGDRPADDDSIPEAPEMCSFDTLCGFNAEFFCRFARDSSVVPAEVVDDFLESEFGVELPGLRDVLLAVEAVNARVFYAGQGYYGIQSCLPGRMGAMRWSRMLLDHVRFVVPAGEMLEFPVEYPGDSFAQPFHTGVGFPTSRCPGPHALIAEKHEALEEARALAQRAKHAVEGLDSKAAGFIVRHFEDWVLFVEGAALTLEALVHHYHICRAQENRGIPDPDRLKTLLGRMSELAEVWNTRQPNDEWWNARGLRYLHGLISRALDCAAPLKNYRLSLRKRSDAIERKVHVFAPLDRRFEVPLDLLSLVPQEIDTGEAVVRSREGILRDGRFELASFFDGNARGRSAYIYIPFDTSADSNLVFMFDLDMSFVAYLDGQQVFDTLKTGTLGVEPVEQGKHMLVVRFISWSDHPVLNMSVFDEKLTPVIG